MAVLFLSLYVTMGGNVLVGGIPGHQLLNGYRHMPPTPIKNEKMQKYFDQKASKMNPRIVSASNLKSAENFT